MVTTYDNALIEALISLTDFPQVLDNEGESVFQCMFCKREGLFAVGNGSIPHKTDCAVALAFRLSNVSSWNTFDELAFKSITHQLAHMHSYPTQPDPDKPGEWIQFCPFCKQRNHSEMMLFHTPDCLVQEVRKAEYLASLRKDRIKYLKEFTWDRVGDEFLQQVVQVFNDNGFDLLK